MKKSLRPEIIKQWEDNSCPHWTVNETVKVATKCDKKNNPSTAVKFRQAVQQNNKQYLRRWVKGCRFSWLKKLKTHVAKGFAAEIMVRDILTKKYNKNFYIRKKDRTLIIGRRSTGKPIPHEFDLVSEDKTIVGEVKAYKHTIKAHFNTRFPRVLKDCFFLEKISAKKKMMIFTNKETYRVMKKDLDGIINSSVEIIYINLNSY